MAKKTTKAAKTSKVKLPKQADLKKLNWYWLQKEMFKIPFHAISENENRVV